MSAPAPPPLRRRRTEAWRFARAVKRLRRSVIRGYPPPPDRHYGAYGWLPTVGPRWDQ